MDIKKIKFETIESKWFYTKPEYSGDPFSEFREFKEALQKTENAVKAYVSEKLGEKGFIFPYPSRMTIIKDGRREYYHITQALYNPECTARILISKSDYSEDVTVIFQIAKA